MWPYVTMYLLRVTHAEVPGEFIVLKAKSVIERFRADKEGFGQIKTILCSNYLVE
jgi:hypothetical protein